MSTDSPTRTARPSASPGTNGSGPGDVEIVHLPHPEGVPTQEQRRLRFADGLRSLRVGAGSQRVGERTLMLVGGVLVPVGSVIVLLGWWGASQTPYVFEQVPYLISGGLFGLALVFLGAFSYFAHWLTELVREHRAQSRAILDALERLADQVGRLAAGTPLESSHPGSPATAADVEVPLVATARGTMAHRPDCVVVAGKADLHRVSPADGLAPCKLCAPPTP